MIVTMEHSLGETVTNDCYDGTFVRRTTNLILSGWNIRLEKH